MRRALSIPGELIPRAGVWLDPGITLCAKTPALAPDVEISQSNCISESQIMLHTRGSMPFWRIVFSTFRGCMSFYTARVKSVVVSQVHASFYFRFAPETGRKFKAWRPRQRGDFTDAELDALFRRRLKYQQSMPRGGALAKSGTRPFGQ